MNDLKTLYTHKNSLIYVAKTDEMNVMLAVILLISKIARLIEIEDFKYWFCHNLDEI